VGPGIRLAIALLVASAFALQERRVQQSIEHERAAAVRVEESIEAAFVWKRAATLWRLIADHRGDELKSCGWPKERSL